MEAQDPFPEVEFSDQLCESTLPELSKSGKPLYGGAGCNKRVCEWERYSLT